MVERMTTSCPRNQYEGETSSGIHLEMQDTIQDISLQVTGWSTPVNAGQRWSTLVSSDPL